METHNTGTDRAYVQLAFRFQKIGRRADILRVKKINDLFCQSTELSE